jgi:hypothetical protein
VTTSRADEVAVRAGRPRQPRTVVEAIADALRRDAAAAGHGVGLRWPSARYRDDPLAFFREILGVEPWSRQIDVIEAVRDHPRVAVSSGHKVSKSHTAAGIALWFFSSFEGARVVMTSTTSRQVDAILWRELRMMHARAGRCVTCRRDEPDGARPCPHSALVSGEPRELARSGLKSRDFREIVGFTAREAEAVAGVSGEHLLYLVDEASGVDDAIYEAIEGNRAGGARIVMFSNPTRTEGEFYEAFNAKSKLYKTLTISSEETPNVVSGQDLIPGLATRRWIEEKREEWGEDSPMFKIRVRGEFAAREDGKILSIHAIAEAEKRWGDADDSGRLVVGIDPAGEGGQGDESVFAPRRAQKILALYALRGLTPEAHLAHLLGMLRRYRRPSEPAPPLVVLDRDGAVGARVYGTLRGHLDAHPDDYELVGVRGSDAADGGAPGRAHDRVRDQLWFVFAAWLRDGGAIPEDARLAKELHAPEWRRDLRGRDKVTSKDDLRRMLGRSPDRADACCLSTWEGRSLRDTSVARAAPPPMPQDFPVLDPYAGLRAWESR